MNQKHDQWLKPGAAPRTIGVSTARISTSAVEDVSLDDPLPFDKDDDKPEPEHPTKVWVLCAPENVPKYGLDYATPDELGRRFAQSKVANDPAPNPVPHAAAERPGAVRLEFATREEFVAFVAEHAQEQAERVYMTVSEYAKYRGLAKRTIESRILEGMPLEGRSKHRRVHVEHADEWFRAQRPGAVPQAKANALRAVAALRSKP